MATVTRIAKLSLCTRAIITNRECVLVNGHDGPCSIVPTVDLPAMDEAWQARCERLASVLHDVLRLCVDRKQHAFADAQQALNDADALLVEAESW